MLKMRFLKDLIGIIYIIALAVWFFFSAIFGGIFIDLKERFGKLFK